MHPKRKQRLIIILLVLLGIGIALGLVLYALQENLNHFYTPTEVTAGKAPLLRQIRVGGLVVEDSLKRSSTSLDLEFVITDLKHSMTVYYTGILPDLFREGQGIIAIGKLKHPQHFQANEVLAKHDENYMPPEVSAALQSP